MSSAAVAASPTGESAGTVAEVAGVGCAIATAPVVQLNTSLLTKLIEPLRLGPG
jgi:hypothetical protein